MKKTQKLFLLTLVGLYVNFLYTSDKSSKSTDSMNSVHSEKYMESHNFFIERPNKSGGTSYFDEPIVFRAKVNRGKKALPWLKKTGQEATLIITDPINGNEETVPLADFIQCDGPDRTLSQKQHLRLVSKLINKLDDF